MVLIGITGTNGKTTTAYLVESILYAAGLSAGVISTVDYRYGGKSFANPVTTPESLDLQKILSQMASAGVTHVVFEVSSHAIELSRIHDCHIDVGVFTNLTQDHLDFHKSMDDYWAVKKSLFTRHLKTGPKKNLAKAVINRVSEKGRALFDELAGEKISTGTEPGDMVRAHLAKMDLTGLGGTIQTAIGGFEFSSRLVGRHNLENILCAAGVGMALKIPLHRIKSGVENLAGVPGRLERVDDPAGRFIYVDYAHTPDALESSLSTLKPMTPKRLVTVFGCGGDRDRGKRPKMGGIAAKLSDLSIVTSDNPRSESPEAIIDDILAGMAAEEGRRYRLKDLPGGFRGKGYAVSVDRRRAIAEAIRVTGPGDTILIAGKGHETYQIIGNRTIDLDDRMEARNALKANGSSSKEGEDGR
jgi:UDP-N-acetylmuramyl-tripeptide synthetase